MDSRYDLGPWACTMKLCDVPTNSGLMRGHGLITGGFIHGWVYTRVGLYTGGLIRGILR